MVQFPGFSRFKVFVLWWVKLCGSRDYSLLLSSSDIWSTIPDEIPLEIDTTCVRC